VIDVIIQDLAKSGIPWEEAEKRGWYDLHEQPNKKEKIKEDFGFSKYNGHNILQVTRAILVIPYHGIPGISTDGEFKRGKLFPEIDGARYLQRPRSGVRLYIDPEVQRNMKDPTKPIILCEGEKKAFAGILAGLDCIAIGGIWNWLESKQPIKDLNAIAWAKRNVTIIPDSDVWARPDLLNATYALGKELEIRGAEVKVKILPSINGQKAGLDDFLVAYNHEEFDKLNAISLNHKAFTRAKQWHKDWIAKRNSKSLNRQPDEEEPATGLIQIHKSFSPRPFTKRLMAKHRLLFDTSRRFWIYDPASGLWNEPAETILENELRDQIIAPESMKSYYINEVIADIRSLCFTQEDIAFPAPTLIAFQNGIYDLEKAALKSFTPELFFIRKLNVEYNPNATCATIDRIFSELVDRDRIIDLYEMMAYCMYREYIIHKMFFLHGRGSNGKTTYQRMLETVLGKDSVSSISLTELQYNRFATADLFGKFANISPELDYSELKKTHVIKKLTGGDTIQAERKFQHPFRFQNHAKLFFITNELPRTQDKTIAFYRRIHLVEFPNIFEGEKEDKNLIHRIPRSEYEGLTFKCLKVLEQIIGRRFRLTNETQSGEMAETYERLTDPVGTFIEFFCEKDPGGYISRGEFAQKVMEWQKGKGVRIWSLNEINKEMRKRGYETKKKPFGDKWDRAWLALRWGDEEENFQDFQLFQPFSTNTNKRENLIGNYVENVENVEMDTPPPPCKACGSNRLWRLKNGEKWVCSVCHPPVAKEDEIVWSDTG